MSVFRRGRGLARRRAVRGPRTPMTAALSFPLRLAASASRGSAGGRGLRRGDRVERLGPALRRLGLRVADPEPARGQRARPGLRHPARGCLRPARGRGRAGDGPRPPAGGAAAAPPTPPASTCLWRWGRTWTTASCTRRRPARHASTAVRGDQRLPVRGAPAGALARGRRLLRLGSLGRLHQVARPQACRARPAWCRGWPRQPWAAVLPCVPSRLLDRLRCLGPFARSAAARPAAGRPQKALGLAHCKPVLQPDNPAWAGSWRMRRACHCCRRSRRAAAGRPHGCRAGRRATTTAPTASGARSVSGWCCPRRARCRSIRGW